MNSTVNTPLGFVAACKQFFGFLPGQGLLDFRNEVAKLSPEDRKEIHAGLLQNGVNVKELTE